MRRKKKKLFPRKEKRQIWIPILRNTSKRGIFIPYFCDANIFVVFVPRSSVTYSPRIFLQGSLIRICVASSRRRDAHWKATWKKEKRPLHLDDAVLHAESRVILFSRLSRSRSMALTSLTNLRSHAACVLAMAKLDIRNFFCSLSLIDQVLLHHYNVVCKLCSPIIRFYFPFFRTFFAISPNISR